MALLGFETLVKLQNAECVLLLFPGGNGDDSMSQYPPKLTVEEGQMVTMTCIYPASYNHNTAFWYIQYPGHAPRYVLKKYNSERGDRSPDFTERFSADYQKTNRTVPLTISGVVVSDSAVYLCAMEPTLLQRRDRTEQKLNLTSCMERSADGALTHMTRRWPWVYQGLLSNYLYKSAACSFH